MHCLNFSKTVLFCKVIVYVHRSPRTYVGSLLTTRNVKDSWGTMKAEVCIYFEMLDLCKCCIVVVVEISLNENIRVFTVFQLWNVNAIMERASLSSAKPSTCVWVIRIDSYRKNNCDFIHVVNLSGVSCISLLVQALIWLILRLHLLSLLNVQTELIGMLCKECNQRWTWHAYSAPENSRTRRMEGW